MAKKTSRVTNKKRPGSKFAAEYVKDYSAEQAAIRAGFTKSSARKNCAMLVRRHAKEIAALQDQKSTVLGTKLALDQEEIIQVFLRNAFQDPADFIEYVEVSKNDKGEPVMMERRKPVHKLTKEQRQVITNVKFKDGEIAYDLSDPYPYRRDLGKHLGLFLDTLIQEHRHRHMHAHIDLSHVPSDQLRKMEANLLEMLGQQGQRMIGNRPVIHEEMEE